MVYWPTKKTKGKRLLSVFCLLRVRIFEREKADVKISLYYGDILYFLSLSKEEFSKK